MIIAANATDSNYTMPRLMRIDSAGNIIWSRQMLAQPDSNRGKFVDVVATHDSCFLAAGVVYHHVDSGGIFLHKFDIDGTTLWSRTYLPDACSSTLHGMYDPFMLIRSVDNGFAISGSGGRLNEHAMFLLKTDSAGNPEWFRAYSDDYELRFLLNNLCQDNDSGFVMFCQYDWLGQDGLIVHTDKHGNLIWSASLDSNNADRLSGLYNIDGDVYLSFENGFIKSELDSSDFWVKLYTPDWNGEIELMALSGCANKDLIGAFGTSDGGGLQLGTVRTDSAQNIRSVNRMDVLSRPEELMELPDGRFFYQGTGYFMNQSFVDVILLDSTGSSSCVPGSASMTTDSVHEKLSSASVIEIVCSVNSYSHSVNWNDTGSVMDFCLLAGIVPERINQISVFPNPASNLLQIESAFPLEHIEVYNLGGQTLISVEPKDNDVRLDFSKQAPGVYILKAADSRSVHVRKIIIHQ